MNKAIANQIVDSLKSNVIQNRTIFEDEALQVIFLSVGMTKVSCTLRFVNKQKKTSVGVAVIEADGYSRMGAVFSDEGKIKTDLASFVEKIAHVDGVPLNPNPTFGETMHLNDALINGVEYKRICS